MKSFDNYKEDYFIVQRRSEKNYNAIDSNFLTTNTVYLRSLMHEITSAEVYLLRYFISQGEIVRFHKNEGFSLESSHWNDPRTVSRDNSLGCLIACSELSGYIGRINARLFALKTIKRLSFFQNTHTTKMKRKILPDVCFPDSWAIILRAIKVKSPILWPLILICDAFFTLNILIFIVRNKFFDNDYNSPLYHMVSSVYFCVENFRNPISVFNRWLLITKCPVNRDFKMDGDLSNVVGQLRQYSRQSYDPPIERIVQILLIAKQTKKELGLWKI